jgi:hypothetical protein
MSSIPPPNCRDANSSAPLARRNKPGIPRLPPLRIGELSDLLEGEAGLEVGHGGVVAFEDVGLAVAREGPAHARDPALAWIAGGLLTLGATVLAGGTTLIAITRRRALA